MLNDPSHALQNTSTATAPLAPWDQVSIWTSKACDEVSYNPDRTVEDIVSLTRHDCLAAARRWLRALSRSRHRPRLSGPARPGVERVNGDKFLHYMSRQKLLKIQTCKNAALPPVLLLGLYGVNFTNL